MIARGRKSSGDSKVLNLHLFFFFAKKTNDPTQRGQDPLPHELVSLAMYRQSGEVYAVNWTHFFVFAIFAKRAVFGAEFH